MIFVKRFLFGILLFSAVSAKAQKVDSIFVNLYTDSLKKGTYNYINVDGLLSDGRYLPLDSNHIIFSCSHGTFYGNSLFIDKDTKLDKINIHVALKKNPAMHKDFVMYIKKKEDDEKLRTAEEILADMRKDGKEKKKEKKKE